MKGSKMLTKNGKVYIWVVFQLSWVYRLRLTAEKNSGPSRLSWIRCPLEIRWLDFAMVSNMWNDLKSDKEALLSRTFHRLIQEMIIKYKSFIEKTDVLDTRSQKGNVIYLNRIFTVREEQTTEYLLDVRYKARWVPGRFSLIKTADALETFNSAIKFSSGLLLLLMCLIKTCTCIKWILLLCL